MELILWRHAEAADGTPDAERRLTTKGRRQAKRVAQWLGERLPKGTRVLASPARRAQQTARVLVADFETVAALDVGAAPEAVLATCGWPEAEATVVVVGHQPTLGQAAALALTGRVQDWSLKKGALVWLESRVRGGARQVLLRAAIGPDLA